MILALAVSVNLSAATFSLGTVKILLSSVTVPTTTAVLCCLDPKFLTNLEIERAGLLILEAISLLNIVFEKLESVLLERNLKSLMSKC